MNSLKYRMYGLVPFSLSPIQQAIQFGHGVVEYMRFEYTHGEDSPCNKWADEDKTFIILNGGTTNLDGSGTLNQHLETLGENNVTVSIFYEPDLGGQLTSVNFLVDERVWDKEKYPDRFLGGYPNINEDNILKLSYYPPESIEKYTKRLGGKTNVFLREFISKFKLA